MRKNRVGEARHSSDNADSPRLLAATTCHAPDTGNQKPARDRGCGSSSCPPIKRANPKPCVPAQTRIAASIDRQTDMLTPSYKIRPIRAEFLDKVRTQGLDDLDQPVERHIAVGGEPCRDVLRAALPGEAIILASYCPFSMPGPYKEYGPVYVLAEASTATPELGVLPIGADTGYFGKVFVLRAYSKAERIVDALLTTPEAAETGLRQLLAQDRVDFVLARFAGYGCYGCRIERA
ncbi:DUF1203 domain-containing protein [Roseateles oligotrophus]|uniref:DUF1203 domain-containing protein n=1 Tax=Roseateles oligotrophus TaxID=1769250 RepID=A0ABT2YHU1_9BURK|nr:DUF1203 domain-containing protein [Roseateles oligotrophus]MCV2369593.1 DUF1203 domain-containing protein [Roseateles oligotrophus]